MPDVEEGQSQPAYAHPIAAFFHAFWKVMASEFVPPISS